MAFDPSIYPFGYEAELPDGAPCYRRPTPYGWEVQRRYLLYDGRRGSDLSAVYATEAEAISHEAHVAKVLVCDRPGGRTE